MKLLSFPVRTFARRNDTHARAQNVDRRSLNDGRGYVRERRQHHNVVHSRAQLLRLTISGSCSAKHAPRFHLNAHAWSLIPRRCAHNARPRAQNADRRAVHEDGSGQNGYWSAQRVSRMAPIGRTRLASVVT